MQIWQDNIRQDAEESARLCGDRLGIITAEVRVSVCCFMLRQSTLKCWKSAQEWKVLQRAGQKEEKWKNRTLIWTSNCKFYPWSFFFFFFHSAHYKCLTMLLLLAFCAWAHRRIIASNKLKAIPPAIDARVHWPQARTNKLNKKCRGKIKCHVKRKPWFFMHINSTGCCQHSDRWMWRLM